MAYRRAHKTHGCTCSGYWAVKSFTVSHKASEAFQLRKRASRRALLPKEEGSVLGMVAFKRQANSESKKASTRAERKDLTEYSFILIVKPYALLFCCMNRNGS